MDEGWEAVVVPGQKEGHSSLRASVNTEARRRRWGQADSRQTARSSRDRVCQGSMRDREGLGLR